MTEILFKSKLSHKEENKLPPNAKIQETDPLVSLRFGSWRFTCDNRQKFCAPFGCRISLWTKVVYILKTVEIMLPSSSAKSDLEPDSAGSFFSDCSRFWNPQSLPQQQSKYSAFPPNRFFYHPDSGWSRDQPQPGSFSQQQREAEEREPGNEVVSWARWVGLVPGDARG